MRRRHTPCLCVLTVQTLMEEHACACACVSAQGSPSTCSVCKGYTQVQGRVEQMVLSRQNGDH